MNRKLKALGLALFAAFALSAVGASAASADEFISEATGNSTVVTATADEEVQHEFHAFGSTVKCKVTNFSGTQTGATATELTVTPTYDECEWQSQHAEVRTNHCDYTFTGETDEGDAPVHVECGEEHIEIEIPTLGHCNFTIGSQTTGGGVTYTNLEDGTVTVGITATVNMQRDSGSFLCNLLPKEGTGAYTGSSIIVGYEDKGGPTTEFTGDETATTEGVGTTHWTWPEDTSQVDIEVEST